MTSQQFDTYQNDINQEIPLYSGEGELHFKNKIYKGQVKLKGVFLPKSSFTYIFSGSDSDGILKQFGMGKTEAKLVINKLNFSSDVKINKKKYSSDKKLFDFSGLVSTNGDSTFRYNDDIDVDDDDDIDALFFSVFNMPCICSEPMVKKGNNFCSRLTFPDDEFLIILDLIPKHSEKYIELKKIAGHLITYNGVLSRKDNKPFKKK